jgi:hypothetical protein
MVIDILRRGTENAPGPLSGEDETGTDGFMDTDDHPRFAHALGAAVITLWAGLPQEIQQALFEQAVSAGHRDERDESLREQLAVFLHDKNPRTAG